MKKVLIIAVVLMFALTGCIFDKFGGNEGEVEGESVVGEPQVHTYKFNLNIDVADAMKDAMAAAISKRLKVYGYESEEDKVELIDSKTVEVTVKEKTGVIFLENEFVQYMLNTPTFEIRAQEDPDKLVMTDAEKTQLEQFNNDAKTKAQSLLAGVLANPDTFAEVAKNNSEDPGSAENGGAYTGIKKGQFVPEYENVIFGDLAVGAIHSELVETQFGFHIIKKDAERGSGEEAEVDTSHILITKQTEEQVLAAKQWLETGLTGVYIDIVNPVQQAENDFAFQILFNEEGKQRLAQLTKASVGKQIAIFIDGVGIGAPTVENEITNGELVITGEFTQESVIAVAQRLSGGVVQYPLQLIDEASGNE
jgi:hypothetical protein